MINTDPNHKHTYDAQGRMTCCSLEEKVYTKADAKELLDSEPKGNELHDHDEEHEHSHEEEKNEAPWKQYLPSIISLVLLLTGIILDYLKVGFFTDFVQLTWYVVAYIPVGFPVMKEGWEALKKKEFFTEFTLMTIATLGAFAIGEYPEGVAVMLFYAIGELFQSAAVRRAKGNIKALLDVRPTEANVLRNDQYKTVKPDEVIIGETIQIKVGEKVPLDGEMLSEGSSFNTAALTGESKPRSIYKSQQVLAGMLNIDKVIELKVTKTFSDSSLSRILEMVQNATARKAKTELFIRKFAKIYTPIVFLLALTVVFLPYFILEDYNFKQWLYRGLIFLVISCPCALVISIPLGYFGGIGAASRNGILFKGSNYLDLMTKLNTVVMDKTGTLTQGVFKVSDIVVDNFSKEEFIRLLTALEAKSTHPIARAIVEYQKDMQMYEATDIEEISGHGLKGKVKGVQVLAGNTKLLRKFNIEYDKKIDSIIESMIVVAFDGNFVGYVVIADQIKHDAAQSIKDLHKVGIKEVIMLSGDKDSITQKVAENLSINSAFGDLLPEDKVQKVEELKKDNSKILAFVGDGINDAPVLALSDVGIAMGAMGSDAAIETADVVIQTDQPSKIVTAIKIGKATRMIVIQNIFLAFAVKVIVLGLGAGGLATMWEAVFADVGVALLAILNAVRIQRMNFYQT